MSEELRSPAPVEPQADELIAFLRGRETATRSQNRDRAAGMYRKAVEILSGLNRLCVAGGCVATPPDTTRECATSEKRDTQEETIIRKHCGDLRSEAHPSQPAAGTPRVNLLQTEHERTIEGMYRARIGTLERELAEQAICNDKLEFRLLNANKALATAEAALAAAARDAERFRTVELRHAEFTGGHIPIDTFVLLVGDLLADSFEDAARAGKAS